MEWIIIPDDKQDEYRDHHGDKCTHHHPILGNCCIEKHNQKFMCRGNVNIDIAFDTVDDLFAYIEDNTPAIKKLLSIYEEAANRTAQRTKLAEDNGGYPYKYGVIYNMNSELRKQEIRMASQKISLNKHFYSAVQTPDGYIDIIISDEYRVAGKHLTWQKRFNADDFNPVAVLDAYESDLPLLENAIKNLRFGVEDIISKQKGRPYDWLWDGFKSYFEVKDDILFATFYEEKDYKRRIVNQQAFAYKECSDADIQKVGIDMWNSPMKETEVVDFITANGSTLTCNIRFFDQHQSRTGKLSDFPELQKMIELLAIENPNGGKVRIRCQYANSNDTKYFKIRANNWYYWITENGFKITYNLNVNHCTAWTAIDNENDFDPAEIVRKKNATLEACNTYIKPYIEGFYKNASNDVSLIVGFMKNFDPDNIKPEELCIVVDSYRNGCRVFSGKFTREELLARAINCTDGCI